MSHNEDREALARLVASALWNCVGHENLAPHLKHYTAADAILAAGFKRQGEAEGKPCDRCGEPIHAGQPEYGASNGWRSHAVCEELAAAQARASDDRLEAGRLREALGYVANADLSHEPDLRLQAERMRETARAALSSPGQSQGLGSGEET